LTGIKYERVMGVKTLARTGWMLRGIHPQVAETVASHTFETAFITMLIVDEVRKAGLKLDGLKALEIALLHDIPESVEGDIVKWSKDRLEEVVKLEESALKELGLEIYSWIVEELDELSTPEAVIVKIADNLATALQAARYVRIGYGGASEILDSCLKAARKLARTRLSGDLSAIVGAVVEDLAKNCYPRSSDACG